jgi:hypothetical protein
VVRASEILAVPRLAWRVSHTADPLAVEVAIRVVLAAVVKEISEPEPLSAMLGLFPSAASRPEVPELLHDARGKYGRSMRFAVPLPETAYVTQLAGGDAGLWGACCDRMGELIESWPRGGSFAAGWLDPYRQVLMQATGLLIYVVVQERRADPVAVSARDLLGWLDAHPVPAPSREFSRRSTLAAALRAAGHEVSDMVTRRNRRECDTGDPVVVAWMAAAYVDDDHVPTIDGTYGVDPEVGLQQLTARVTP